MSTATLTPTSIEDLDFLLDDIAEETQPESDGIDWEADDNGPMAIGTIVGTVVLHC